MSEDVLEKYEFHVKIAEEDVRDGDATPWERVVGAFASTIRELQAQVETTTWYNGTLLTELSTLRERVAELEELDLVFHELIADPEANIVLRAFGLGYLMEKEDTSLYQMSECFDTPEAALEAVRKEEP